MYRTPELDKPQRLVSLDAYRGFVMLAMVTGGLGFTRVASQFPDSATWQFLSYQFDHVAWTGCSFWDLIQPSFMFMVGVALPFSYASRRAKGHSLGRIGAHAVYRALLLILLGIFFRSTHRDFTNFTFEDVITQIGLGYVFLYVLLNRGFFVQCLALGALLVGYGYAFYQHPLPSPEQVAAMGLPSDWQQFADPYAAHWNKHTNFAASFDRWFMNLFPRPEPFVYNGGGYQTLSFIPSLGTMILGLMTGEMLRSARNLVDKYRLLLAGGAFCLGLGMALDGHIWPVVDWSWTLCPIVKRIWTPSWTIFSTGWTLWMLAAFFWLIEIRGYRRWAFALVVVGMNSIAIYTMSKLMMGWASETLATHFEMVKPWLGQVLGVEFGRNIFDFTYGPIARSVAVTFVLWLFCLWMYRRRIFLRI